MEEGLYFKVINRTSRGEKELCASNGKTIVNETWTTTVILNGKPTVVSGSSKSNELPVMAGDEIEVVFTPACKEESEASFLLPDGTSKTVTASSPSFRWIVPENFTSGMKIEGRSSYRIKDIDYVRRGVITLISIVENVKDVENVNGDENVPDTERRLRFKATNCSSPGGDESCAYSGLDIIININNGNISSITCSKELQVKSGDEIEVEFMPTCDEESEASFLLPDGTSKTVTASSPSFRWIVPENFTSGMKIEGRSSYEIEDKEHVRTGEITLVSGASY